MGQTTPLPCPGMQLFGQVSLVTGYTDSLQAGLSQKGDIVEGSGVSYGEACGQCQFPLSRILWHTPGFFVGQLHCSLSGFLSFTLVDTALIPGREETHVS